MEVISVMNYKGGVGKTTVTANLSGALARRGYRVLMLDLDPQSSLTFSFFTSRQWNDELQHKKTIKRWFDEVNQNQGSTDFSDLVLHPPAAEIVEPPGALDLIASHLGLINADLQLASHLVGMSFKDARANYLRVHRLLSSALAEEALKDYDFAIIDCPPNFNLITKTAIVASHHLLIPSRADDLSTKGILYLQQSLQELVNNYNDYASGTGTQPRATENIDPKILGIVFNMISFRNGVPVSSNQEFITRTQKEYGVPVFDAKLRSSTKHYADASKTGTPLTLAPPLRDPPLQQELQHLTDEVLQRLSMEIRR